MNLSLFLRKILVGLGVVLSLPLGAMNQPETPDRVAPSLRSLTALYIVQHKPADKAELKREVARWKRSPFPLPDILKTADESPMKYALETDDGPFFEHLIATHPGAKSQVDYMAQGSSKRQTPLHYAAMYGRADKARRLLAIADTRLEQDKQKRRPIDYAFNERTLEALISQQPVEPQRPQKGSLAHDEAYQNELATYETLHQEYEEALEEYRDATSDYLRPALTWAIKDANAAEAELRTRAERPAEASSEDEKRKRDERAAVAVAVINRGILQDNDMSKSLCADSHNVVSTKLQELGQLTRFDAHARDFLRAAMLGDNIERARFVFEQHAGLKQQLTGCGLLSQAKSQAMADLFFEHNKELVAKTLPKEGPEMLFIATLGKKEWLVRFLLAHGVSPCVQHNYMYNPELWDMPLHRAQTPALAKLLLDADPSTLACKDAQGKTPLIECKNSEGKTPLIAAAWEDRTDVAAFLIEQGASVRAVDNNGAIALHHAHSVPMAELLLKADPTTLEFRDNAQKTPLIAVVSRLGGLDEEKTAVAGFLIEKGASVRAADSSGSLPLHYASQVGVAEKLLAADPSTLEALNRAGNTPLVNICKKSMEHESFKDLTSFLVAQGANKNARDMYGKTLLHNSQSGECTKKLLELGFDCLARDDKKRAPLHYARDSRAVTSREFTSTKVLRALIMAQKIVLFAEDVDGKTPVHCLVNERTDKERDAVIREVGACVKELRLDPQTVFNCQDNNGKTPLHCLIEQATLRDAATVALLIEQGADIENVRDNTGKTVLDYIMEKTNACKWIAKIPQLKQPAFLWRAQCRAGGSVHNTALMTDEQNNGVDMSANEQDESEEGSDACSAAAAAVPQQTSSQEDSSQGQPMDMEYTDQDAQPAARQVATVRTIGQAGPSNETGMAPVYDPAFYQSDSLGVPVDQSFGQVCGVEDQNSGSDALSESEENSQEPAPKRVRISKE